LTHAGNEWLDPNQRSLGRAAIPQPSPKFELIHGSSEQKLARFGLGRFSTVQPNGRVRELTSASSLTHPPNLNFLDAL
jgi:hypothetical protein